MTSYLTTSARKHNAWGITGCFMLAAAATMMPELAAAAAADSSNSNSANASIVSSSVCNVVNVLQGPIARGVAAIGIIFLGFSLFMGKISWGTALALGIGCAAIFGAKTIMGVFGGGTGQC